MEATGIYSVVTKNSNWKFLVWFQKLCPHLPDLHRWFRDFPIIFPARNLHLSVIVPSFSWCASFPKGAAQRLQLQPLSAGRGSAATFRTQQLRPPGGACARCRGGDFVEASCWNCVYGFFGGGHVCILDQIMGITALWKKHEKAVHLPKDWWAIRVLMLKLRQFDEATRVFCCPSRVLRYSQACDCKVPRWKSPVWRIWWQKAHCTWMEGSCGKSNDNSLFRVKPPHVSNASRSLHMCHDPMHERYRCMPSSWGNRGLEFVCLMAGQEFLRCSASPVCKAELFEPKSVLSTMNGLILTI